MDGRVETSNMDSVQDANQKVEGEEKKSVTATSEKATPPAPKASAPPEKPKAAAKPAVGSSAGAKGKTVESLPDNPVNKMRRTIIWTSVGGFLATCFMMFLRFFLPRTIFEPSTVFRVGYASDFGFGVDTKFQQQYRIWVVRNAERLFVIYARCTHLGCTPDWKPGENKFKCPCHGSGYTNEGINFEGPAPRPMDRAHVELDPTGQIVVNTAKLYEWPKGDVAPGHFDEPGAYISV
jgi:cytochrome b6-f complex iron-sulfur subunit